MAINNPTGNYPDFIIKDISGSASDLNRTSVDVPVFFTIDGPLSLKNTNQPYKMTVSKLKDK